MKYVGLEVHKDSIDIAVAEADAGREGERHHVSRQDGLDRGAPALDHAPVAEPAMRAARDVDGRHALANVQERDGALIVYNSATLKEVTRPAGTAH